MIKTPSNYKSILWLIGMVLLTTLIYLPVLNNDFLKTWDDNRYILDNQLIRDLSFQNVVHLFTIYFDGHYHPLTLLSLALDYSVDGLNPKVFHLTNLLLHLISMLLVFRFISLLLNGKKLFIPLVTALLFGIATMQVESVAWATERKNVLYAVFFFASLVTYVLYVKKESMGFYYLSLLFFIFSLLSKSMAIPLCVTLLVIDYYFGRGLLSRRVILEKIPFFILAIGAGVVAVFAQQSTWGENLSQVHYSFPERVIFAGYAFIQYIIKLIIPVKLSGFYPYPEVPGRIHYFFGVLALLLGAGIVYFIYKYHRTRKMLVFGILFFVVNIFLLLKLFEVPAGDYIMADRYAYVPSVGLFFLLATGFERWSERNRMYRWIVRGLLVIYVVFISLQTVNRVQVFENDEQFYSDIITGYPGATVAYTNRGALYKERGKYSDALADFSQAIRNGSAGYKEYANRGFTYNEMGEYQKAAGDFKKSLSIKSGDPLVISGYAFSLLHSGNFKGAINNYSKVIQMQPDNVEAITNRGTAYYSMGNYQRAIQDYNNALTLQPEYLTALFNRGLAKLNSNDTEGAIDDLLAVIKIDPDYAGVYSNLGVAYSKMGLEGKAFASYDKAIQLDPANYEAYLNRGIDRYFAGDYQKALDDLSEVIRLNQNLGAAWYFRGMVFLKIQPEKACTDLGNAMKLGFKPAAGEYELHCK